MLKAAAGRSRPWGRAVWLAWLLALWMGCLAGTAQAAPTAADPALVEQARETLEEIRARLPTVEDDTELGRLQQRALQSYELLGGYVTRLMPEQAALTDRILQLGEVPEGGEERPEVAQQRTQLNDEAQSLEAQSRLASLLRLEFGQAIDDMTRQRRALFQAQLGQRSPSILTGRFWSTLDIDHPWDVQGRQVLFGELRRIAASLSTWTLGLMAAWVAVLLLAYRRVRLRLSAVAVRRVPSGRLRRCAYAWAQVALAVATPLLALGGLYLFISWAQPLPEPLWRAFVGLIGAAAYGGYVYGLWRALLSADSPSWRLPPLSDAIATRLAHLPVLAATLLVGHWLALRLGETINARLGITMMIDVAFVLMLIALCAGFLWAGGRRSGALSGPSAATWVSGFLRRYRGWLRTACWLVLAVSLFSVLTGYVAFAKFLVQQLIWTGVILSTAYLVSVTISDLAAALVRPSANDAMPAEGGCTPVLGIGRQWVVLAAGLAQACMALLAVILFLASFGANPLDVGMQVQNLRGSFAWGEVQIKPWAIIQSLCLLLVGAALVQVVKRWVSERFLPMTSLEPSVQSSLSTLAGYLGYVVVMAVALSATGLGFEKVTWIASALSVGIGFGLQAIVQNFVSGLILLAERPVKVGDWVSLGGVEGDIRQINVRATEIQLSDRSTVIMPNSELVTKMVRNVTYAGAQGRVQIKLPVPLSVSADQMRALIQQAFVDHPMMLLSPAPQVHIDDISGGSVLFNAVGYVSSPRQVYAVRSALFYDILARCDAAGIVLAPPASMVLSERSDVDALDAPPVRV